MNHQTTKEDEEFKEAVESCSFPVPQFDHKAHLRLAYVYLVLTNDPSESVKLVRSALVGLLKHAGVDPSTKYHATLTEAWLLAVHHFMLETTAAISADDFINQNPKLLDSKIMLTHYSNDVLFSEAARQQFIEPNLEPNLEPIPKHAKLLA